MKPEDIYNGLEYTTKEINRTFKIKVNGLFNGKKINTLVGNLKELQNIKRYLPETWTELMELQNRIPQPFKPGRKNKKTGELIPGKTIHYFNELWHD